MTETDPQKSSEDAYVVGVDYGTLSGRALVVRVADGAEMGSATHEYTHAVLEDALPGGTPLAPGLGAAGSPGLPRRARTAVPAALTEAGIDPAQVIGIATDFTACTMVPTLADGTPLYEVDGYDDRPHAYVKLWKHHAAQPQADRINALAEERERGLAAPLRRADLLGVGVRQGAAALRGGPRALRPDGPLGRGRRLDRVAAVRQLRPQRLHRRLQGHPPGRAVPEPEFLEELAPGFGDLRRRQARAAHRPARRPGRTA